MLLLGLFMTRKVSLNFRKGIPELKDTLKAWLKLNKDVEILLSSSIFDLEPLLEGLCSMINIEYKSIMSLEDLHLSPPPDGIY